MTDIIAVTLEAIQNQIFTIRGKQVMIDRDLAVLFEVETKVLNQAVKRNLERFPERYMFQLTENEEESLRSQFVTSKIGDNLKSQFVTSSWGGSRKPPSVFTEFGIVMLSSSLRSRRAISISIQITDGKKNGREWYYLKSSVI